ncbi:MAG: acyl carrier protein [Planctomycetota bacterium]|jgi:acyl carrier protein
MADEWTEIKDKVAEIMVERLFLPVEASAIAPEESLTLKYGVDSVRLFDMVVGMEEDFDVSFEDEELTLENFDNLEKICRKIIEKQQADD